MPKVLEEDEDSYYVDPGGGRPPMRVVKTPGAEQAIGLTGTPNKPLYVAGKPSGLVEQGNIDIANRPQVENSDGSISTVRSMGVNIGGKEVLIPTVHESGYLMGDEEAIENYKKTGKHLGVFKSAKDSDKYAQALHEEQEASQRAPTMRVPFVGPQISEDELDRVSKTAPAAPQPKPKPAAKTQGHPWEGWDDEKKKEITKAIRTLDLAKHHQAVGRMFPTKESTAAYGEVAARGGLDSEEATTLARFKMFNETTQNDPNWQGPLNINTGPREAPEAPGQIDARRDAFFSSSPDQKAKILAEEKLAVERSREGFYDSLVPKTNEAVGKVLATNTTKKRKA